jgi:hypothetical protein
LWINLQLTLSFDTDATPFSYQLKLVINRTNLSFFRNANYEVTRVFNHLAVALITGLTYLNLPSTVIGAQYRVFAIFELVVLLPLVRATTMAPCSVR